MSMIRIVIADDYPLFREGIHLMLQKEKDLKITGEAGNGEELLHIVEKQQPDVVLTDIEMPVMNGIEATKRIKRQYPSVGVIALTMYGDEHFLVDMLEAGAGGYLLKSSNKEELIVGVKAVYEGKNYFCEDTSMKMARYIARSKVIPEEKKMS